MYTPPQLTIDHVISLDDDDTQTAACIVLVLSRRSTQKTDWISIRY